MMDHSSNFNFKDVTLVCSQAVRVLSHLRANPGLLKFYLRKFLAEHDADIRLLGKRSLMPLNLFVSPTLNCCNTCEFCFIRKTAAAEHLVELPVRNWFRIIDHLAESRPGVIFLGGEPLFYPDIGQLIHYTVKKRRLIAEIITNGWLLEEHAHTLAASGLVRVNVSIHGTEDLHDRITGHPGAYAKAMRGLRSLERLRAHLGTAAPRIRLCLTISFSNQNAAATEVEKLYELGARSINVQLYQVIGRRGVTEHNRSAPDYLKAWQPLGVPGENAGMPPLDAHQVQEQVARIIAFQQRVGDLEVEFCPQFAPEQIPYFLKQDKTFPYTDQMCKQPWRQAHVLPNGDLAVNVFCFGGAHGNLLRQSLREIWNNERLLKVRSAVLRARQFPFCEQCIGIYPATPYK